MIFRFLFPSLLLGYLSVPGVVFAEAPALQSAIGNPDNFKLSGSVRLRYETLAC